MSGTVQEVHRRIRAVLPSDSPPRRSSAGWVRRVVLAAAVAVLAPIAAPPSGAVGGPPTREASALGPTELLWVDVARFVLALTGADLSLPVVIVDPTTQRLHLSGPAGVMRSWEVSTGRGGISSRPGSSGTPMGAHRVGQVLVGRHGEEFRYRRATGRLRPPSSAASGRAYMTSAVLTLLGQDPGNRSSAARGIYIHGTNLEGSLGSARSAGCIRMANDDVLTLATLVTPGSWVYVLPAR